MGDSEAEREKVVGESKRAKAERLRKRHNRWLKESGVEFNASAGMAGDGDGWICRKPLDD